jgi:hypothetical protein
MQLRLRVLILDIGLECKGLGIVDLSSVSLELNEISFDFSGI